jgi:hypothetical protein
MMASLRMALDRVLNSRLRAQPLTVRNFENRSHNVSSGARRRGYDGQQRKPQQCYSRAHGTKISNISKIHSAIVCCLSSLMAISLADHATVQTSV